MGMLWHLRRLREVDSVGLPQEMRSSSRISSWIEAEIVERCARGDCVLRMFSSFEGYFSHHQCREDRLHERHGEPEASSRSRRYVA